MKSILDVQVSRFEQFTDDSAGENVSLLEWLNGQELIEEIKWARSQDEETMKRVKSVLPCVTVSGLFDGRVKEDLIKHSGLICIDIDYKDNWRLRNISRLKEEICRIRNVAYCGLSFSGKGYFVIIPISDPGKHREYYIALIDIFLSLKIKIDVSCSNVNRLRTISYDPFPYFNHSAVPLVMKIRREQEKQPVFINKSPAVKRVEKCIKKIVTQKIDITENGYQWFLLGCALANEFGEGGRRYFHTISKFYKTKSYCYSAKEADQKFSECIKRSYGSVSIGTFFHLCKNYGITDYL